jgi:cytochrome c7-like protein
MTPFLFPRWTNRAPAIVAVALGCLFVGVVAAFWYWGTEKYWRVGYSPEQPIPFSHKLHAGDLGMDCRYCHSTVERSPFAAVPPTQTCMNCHARVKTDSPKLALLRERAADDKPVPWVRVHDLPDFVYFDHSAHVTSGVGCSSCHGRVDQMARVVQKAPLTMGWCLDCHRNAAPNLRAATEITKMDWQPRANATEARTATGRTAQPPVHCSGCHR